VLFRRSKPDPASTEQSAPKPGGKGRPTPSRREAEAAAKARAKTPRTRKEMAAAQRRTRATSSQRMREAMRSGDERYLPARDKGPVRRFVRDYLDSRLSIIELLLPILLISMVLGYSGSQRAAAVSSAMLLGALLLAVVEVVLLRFRLRRELTRRFPGDPLTGTTYYAVMRAMQIRFLRMPKPQVKIGQQLPEHYH
jgi:hypothetical protein